MGDDNARVATAVSAVLVMTVLFAACGPSEEAASVDARVEHSQASDLF